MKPDSKINCHITHIAQRRWKQRSRMQIQGRIWAPGRVQTKGWTKSRCRWQFAQTKRSSGSFCGRICGKIGSKLRIRKQRKWILDLLALHLLCAGEMLIKAKWGRTCRKSCQRPVRRGQRQSGRSSRPHSPAGPGRTPGSTVEQMHTVNVVVLGYYDDVKYEF